jgi:alpha-glucosidase
MQSLTQSTAELPTDTLAVHVYKGSKANHFVYYEDDGKSFSYQKGDFYKRTIRFDPDKKTITFDKAEGGFKTNFKYIRLVLHGFEQSTSVKAGNSNLKLQDSSIAFLGAAANTDPQGSINRPDSSPVKTVTISNAPNNIQINY